MIANRLINPPSYDTPPALMQRIVGDYLQLLAADGPGVWCGADEQKLPYSKAAIKHALIWAMQRQGDDDGYEHLRQSFLQLGNFQPGIGETNVGYDLFKPDPGLSVPERFRRFAEEAAEFVKWEPQINAERERLESELQQMGLMSTYNAEDVNEPEHALL
jgi:hypothetical protein